MSGNIWYISDIHIGHKSIAGYRAAEQDMGPFWTITDHDQLLADNWDAVIRPDDIVNVLGDLSSGKDDAQFNALEWIKRRPGRKRLISGNHDGTHPMHRDAHKWLPIYLDGAFETVQSAGKQRFHPPQGIDLPEGHKGYLTAFLSHFPYMAHPSTFVADHPGEHRIRYPEWRLPDCGHILIHGHVHSQNQYTIGGAQTFWTGVAAQGKKKVNQIHIGVDAWNLNPVPYEMVRELIWKAEMGWI